MKYYNKKTFNINGSTLQNIRGYLVLSSKYRRTTVSSSQAMEMMWKRERPLRRWLKANGY